MTARGPHHGEVQFAYWPDQPPSTQAGEWRCRLGSTHYGSGPTIGEALDDLARAIRTEHEAVERARKSIRIVRTGDLP